MRILSFVTSSLPGSLALMESSRVVAYQTLDPRRPTTANLTLVMRGLFQGVQWSAGSVDLVAVCGGPGSFTGLRIGITAAKTFAYAVQCRVLAVNTLELLASQVAGDGPVVAVLNAQRGQVFSAVFSEGEGGGPSLEKTSLYDVEDWLKLLHPGQTVTGPVLTRLADRIPAGVVLAPREAWTPRADMLGLLALGKHDRGERQDFWRLRPNYFRKSAAEEKAQGRDVPPRNG